jgi:Transposase
MSVEQQVATGRVTAGVDWASHAHAVALVDGDGVQSQRFTVAHTATELQQMVQRLRRAGVAEVAIERPDGPVVDALLACACRDGQPAARPSSVHAAGRDRVVP